MTRPLLRAHLHSVPLQAAPWASATATRPLSKESDSPLDRHLPPALLCQAYSPLPDICIASSPTSFKSLIPNHSHFAFTLSCFIFLHRTYILSNIVCNYLCLILACLPQWDAIDTGQESLFLVCSVASPALTDDTLLIVFKWGLFFFVMEGQA